MNQLQFAPRAATQSEHSDPLSHLMSKRHQNVLNELAAAFRKSRPLAVLIGEGIVNSSHLIDRFIDEIDADVAVARINERNSDPAAGMRNIIRALGFEANGLSLVDTESVLTMFLDFQKKHHRRTIVCIEEAQGNGRWVLDNVRRLVELERTCEFGLMVVLTGGEGLNKLLSEPPLGAICAESAKRISVAPFSLEETREFILRRIASERSSSITDLIEFEAVTLIHELTNGRPGAISRLCYRCLELQRKEGVEMVTTQLVRRADDKNRNEPDAPLTDPDRNWLQENPGDGRLIIRNGDSIIQERPLNRARILIGRDEVCDVCLTASIVSRHHALLLNSAKNVQLLDLGSTNGTVVGEHRIKDKILEDGDVIVIGGYVIEYVAARSV